MLSRMCSIKNLWRFCLVLLFFVNSIFTLKAQNTSNKGRDFWLGYGNHVRGYSTNSQQMAVYITSDVNTSGQVEIPGINYSKSFNVTANSITVVDIPQSAYLAGEGLYNLGIHVTAERPVVMYAHIYDRNVSGATLVLPTTTLGKEYYSINFRQVSNQPSSFSYFFVVAVEDSTQVEIVPSAATQGHPAGVPFTVNMKKGQVYQVLGKETSSSFNTVFRGVDLTGSTIQSVSSTSESCKPIAVFSGSGKIAIGCGGSESGTSDNLYQQVYPTAAWGSKFITAPLKSRNYDIIRVLKSDPSAVVRVNGTIVNNSQFVNNFYLEFPSQQTNVIESDKPIQVVQYSVTQGKSIDCGGVDEPDGDPEMIFLNSVEQNIDDITVYSSSAFAIIHHFINVVMETSAAASFRIDGAPARFTLVNGAPEYSYAQISVGAGVHNLKADKGFNAIAYGFGVAESYGYSAGANVNNLGIQITSLVSDTLTNTGCVAEPLQFKANLHYQPTRLTWLLGDGSAPRIIDSPINDSTFVKDGRTFYVYELKDTIRYLIAGDYAVDVIADKPSADGCGSAEQLTFEFSIFNPPVASFLSNATACAGVSVQFTDQSDGKGRALTAWLWDFGDPDSDSLNVSTAQNPVHVYNKAGVYPVKLTVRNSSNCDPVVSEIHMITISPKPEAAFSTVGPACETQALQFTDRSGSGESELVKWSWDFGDGQTSGEQNPVHTYVAAGNYQVKLLVENKGSCVSDTFKLGIAVHPKPVVEFETPEICLADAGATFINKSSLPSGDNSILTYLWDFGDRNANAQNPGTSTLENPTHVYTAFGNYTITLTVTSDKGCSFSLSKQLTVNGSIPIADFNILNEGKLCSSQPVIFEDLATVDYGEITRIEWYFDNVNQPTTKLTDEFPNRRADPHKQYTWQYPIFHTPLTQIITVKMLAYSGIVCVDEKIKTFALNAEPEVEFDTIPGICLEEAPVVLTQGRELHGFEGSAQYSGEGVSAQGLFDPKLAGPGTHTITYTFTAANRCIDFKTQTLTVFPTPIIEAGTDQVVLEGGELKLPATATGDNLIYKWTPSTALNRDDILNPVASPIDDITYRLEVHSSAGCLAVDEVFVKVLKTPVIPNTFTPNNDGFNDAWNIKYLNTYPDALVEVFTRYGQIIYTSKGYPVPWDGKFRENDIPIGTYYYIIDPKQGRKIMSGSVTILR
jgi:gliding motility-associated-like protein